MDEFCGTPFWDNDRTWNTSNPDFTVCFEKTALVWFPCGLLWISAGFDVYHSIHSKMRNIPWSPLNVSKLALTILLMVTQLLDLAFSFHYSDTIAMYPVDRYTPIIRIITFGLSLFLVLFGKIHGVRSSGVQFIFWMAIVLCEAFGFRTSIMNPEDPILFFVTHMAYFPILVGVFLLNCWADAAPLYQYQHQTPVPAQNIDKQCPETASSFLSQLLFFWFEGFIWKGYRNPLDTKDLWDLNPEDKSRNLVPGFNKHWDKSLKVSKAAIDLKATFEKSNGSLNIKTEKSKDKVKNASVLPTLVKIFGPTFLFGAMLKVCQDLLTFVSPQILNLLIAHVNNSEEENWKGYLYALILFIASMVQTFFLSQYFHRMFLIGMRIRTTLVSAIYRKSLLISNVARKESTIGEIVNLMSVDAQRLMDLTAYINMLWSAPLQIALSLYFLWDTLGPSVLAGVGVMILLIPINAVIASKMKALQIRQMKNKDQRVKLMNEILSGIKVLKLYAWERSFQKQVHNIRGKEIKVLKEIAYLNAGSSFIWTCAPFLVSLVTFGTYVMIDETNVLTAEKAFVALTLFNIMRMPMSVLPMMVVFVTSVAVTTFSTYVLSSEKNVLTPQKAFVSLALFNILRFPLTVLPMMLSSFVQAQVSLNRLNKFLNAEEIDPNSVSHEENKTHPVVVENGTFAWEAGEPVLKNINFKVEEGSLVAIVGTVGSGKSSLLASLLGELEKVSGTVNTKGSIAYVAQQAWIQNATLKDNILFGQTFDPSKYDKVVDACALKPDLEILPAGDKTEIGEKGINLSGGQKQRVSLARATYSDTDLYIFDDPLSAVDSHVGKHIFEKVLGPKGILKKKTRLLVTHGIIFLPQCDNIIVMKDGEISETGTYRELLEKKGAFADFLVQHIGNEDNEDEESLIQELEGVIGSREEIFKRQRSKVSESEGLSGSFKRQGSIISQGSDSSKASPARQLSKSMERSSIKKAPSKDKLIEIEKAETGSVKGVVYLYYIKAIGWNMTFLTILFHLIYQGFAVGSNIWLSAWADSSSDNETIPISTSDRDMYLGVYGGLGAGQAVSVMVATIVMAIGSLNAGRILHDGMLERILKSPMSFFDTTPLGRVVNRFAKDIDTTDNTIPLNIRQLLNCLFSVISTMVVICYSTPIFTAIIVPIGAFYYFVQRLYVATSRQLKRIESVSRSPIYSNFGETLTGCTTIRAFSMQGRFILDSERLVDQNQIAYYPSIVANRWLAIRLETVGNLLIFFASLFAVLNRDTLSAGLVGLSISYSLSITQTLNWLVRMTSDVETNIVAIERIKEYGETPQEADWEINERKPPKEWPETGQIEFEHYQTRYREGLDLVLRDVTCSINPGEKVGIVGRTGAGKSSLTLGLFRIVEAAGGSVKIDGREIAKLGLHDIRGRITIIPQDPVLFSGTLRINLDPFEQYTDVEIWHSLELAHLKPFVKGLASGLEHEITEGGENLSVGQRQLVCLARALLRKTKILVLDEATAAVDLETDDLIQATIRSEFKDSTVLTIAHRLNTIMDSTRVMVLDKGEIKEFDSPENLLKNKKSIFFSMAKDAGLAKD